MSTFVVPTKPATPQQFTISLAGVTYTVRLTWNWLAQQWILDLYDASGTTLLLGGHPLITGADLLGQFAYLGIGGALVAQSVSKSDATPSFTGLGVNDQLYFVTR